MLAGAFFRFSCLVSAAAFGGSVSDVAVPSRSMGKDIPASVILPTGYDAGATNRWPVVYVLHGAGGSHRRYIDADLGYTRFADRVGAIVVCADGGKTSWWFDSPIDPSCRYETHVAKELAEYYRVELPKREDKMEKTEEEDAGSL